MNFSGSISDVNIGNPGNFARLPCLMIAIKKIELL